MAVKVGPIFNGKLKLFDRMIGFNWKGLQVFRNETGNIVQIPSNAVKSIRTKETELASRWFTGLTQTQRDAWEVYAKMQNSASREVSNRIGNGAKNIIRSKQKLLSGFNAYIGSNIAAFTRGLTIPKDEAPISTPSPTPPLNVAVSIAGYVATVTWLDPPTSMFTPGATVVVTIFIQIQKKRLVPTQIAAILPVPSPGTFNISFVRVGSTFAGGVLPLNKFDKGEFRVQMDTLVSESPPIGAVLSPPSNVATAIIQ
ncbi:MAG: hypothetical protein ACK4NF_05340 [Planctomycetota bacterium]